jgi:hypothetical protein
MTKKDWKHTYHAEAFALGGQMRLPIAQEVKPLAHSKLLDTTGGYTSQQHKDFRLEHVAWFDSAHTHVAGNLDDKPGHGWVTLSTSVVEGLNVLDIVTADRIVTQICTDHPPEGYVPTVTFLGSRFENLRIAGYPVNVKLDLAFMGPKPVNDLPYCGDAGVIDRVKTQHGHIHAGHHLPPELLNRYRLPAKFPKEKKSIECSLVHQVEGDFPGRSFGHVIDVPHFGKIHLATLKIEESDFDPKTGIPKKTEFTLNMIEMEMGCVGSGNLTGGSGKTNGSNT